MLIKRIPAGVYAANCYILMDEITKESAVIDPGGDPEDIDNYLSKIGAEVKYILLTHGHLDHTGAVGYFMEKYKAQAHINEADGKLIIENNFMLGPLKYKGQDVKLTMDVKEGIKFSIGNIVIEVIETPGHTPGGVCYKAENNLFTGDTLFLRSIGRTDLTGGNFETLINSINNKLLVLDEAVNVYPGHGPMTTIGYEKVNNSFL
ncbi:MBL fold metallo-hydrolase [Candidatus Clostridium radicumherbarum]|uniref:MBL fold metallo-hydrolase n=1 Tax=Candidatus Clostridium radicumherbarum TaxID=3381662 RepID=A0ABW8TRV0_9CLOT